MSEIDDQETLSENLTTADDGRLAECISSLAAGDAAVRGELMNLAAERLKQLSDGIVCELPADVAEITEGLFDHASARLYQTLHNAKVTSPREFFRLATREIRRELIELGLLALGRVSVSKCQELKEQIVFHQSVDALSDSNREVFELIWYQDIDKQNVGQLLGIGQIEVRRRWRAARLRLHELEPVIRSQMAADLNDAQERRND